MLLTLPEMVELFNSKTYQMKHKFSIEFVPPEGHQVVKMSMCGLLSSPKSELLCCDISSGKEIIRLFLFKQTPSHFSKFICKPSDAMDDQIGSV